MVKYLALLCLVILCIAHFSESKPAYQVLKVKEGYIPVFIRYGDQPLSEIDPVLAEAFGEHEIAPRNIKDDTSSNDHQIAPVVDTKANESTGKFEGIIKDLLNSAGFGTR
ncbi:hypothetical protein PVAND_004488 [Polypedilum vanderplanki]|uniref:Uncharacterized protein n=1 Tax=Polypedilum vanderplanki TaxID=319348 RepID=A0A9J6BZ95_POLVA|nr:hypothetical protein PVAND_004488 [Polypedilum vanderplanki]